MKLQTIVETIDPQITIQEGDKIAIVGSCFAETIGAKLELTNTKESWESYTIYNNPSGIVYNPLSIATSIETLHSGVQFTAENLVEHNGLFHSMLHHGKFSSTTPQATLQNINHPPVPELDYIIITLGTIYTYFYKGAPIANCHKIPEKEFTRRPLSLEEINTALEKIATLYPTAKIIITISPIRHLRDGLIENSLSKATLRVAAHNFCNSNPTNRKYFPSYEILMDELRDYRFTTEDMCHPTEQTKNYIWERFSTLYLSTTLQNSIALAQKAAKAAAHRTLHK